MVKSYALMLILILFSGLNSFATITGTPVSQQSLKAGQTFTLSTWNIHKEQGPDFLREFARLLDLSDIVCVQEGLLTEDTEAQWNSDYGYEWNFASAWIDGAGPTGTAVLSRLHVDEAQSVVTTVTQPIANTPKSSLISYYAIEGREDRLMVISTHAINFTFMGPFKTQLLELGERIENHHGPIIWAGDFNTWNGNRLVFLQELAASLGLQHAVIDNESRGQILDHIFFRGVSVASTRVLDQWDTSDHKPLLMTATLNP